MRKIIFLFTLWITALAGAQTISKEDANRFEAYFFDSITIGVDFQLTSKIYQALLDDHQFELAYCNSRGYASTNISSYGLSTGTGGYDSYDKRFAKTKLNLMYRQLHVPDYDMETDKQRAKQLIKQFRQEATILPTFYQLIDKKYKGDVDRYVDDLFDKSFMGNKEVLDKLMKRPTLKKLRKDPVVLYTISKMQYLALIKLGEIEQAN